jgi:hypothetical protein
MAIGRRWAEHPHVVGTHLVIEASHPVVLDQEVVHALPGALYPRALAVLKALQRFVAQSFAAHRPTE